MNYLNYKYKLSLTKTGLLKNKIRLFKVDNFFPQYHHMNNNYRIPQNSAGKCPEALRLRA